VLTEDVKAITFSPQMMTPDLENQIEKVSRSLANVHRSLLHSQKAILEKLENRTITVEEFFKLSMAHEDFAWLKPVLKLILSLDDAVAQKEPETLKARTASTIKEIVGLFDGSNPSGLFQTNLVLSLQREQQLWLEVAELRANLKLLA
jgi:hypothetical protein